MLCFKTIFIILLLECVHVTFSEDKLIYPRLLLPYSSFTKVNVSLRSPERDCFKWSSTHPDVIAVIWQPESNDLPHCSREVVVRVVHNQPTQARATVLAEDLITHRTLKCDVTVDRVNRLDIITRTREVHTFDALELLEARALDRYDNTFTTLAGIPFVWSLAASPNTDPSVSPSSILRLSKWEEDPTTGSTGSLERAAIEHLEKEGYQSHRQLFSGLRTGSALVRVRFLETLYAQVPPAEVEITALAHVIARPYNVYLMPCTSLVYAIRAVRHGIYEPLTLPSDEFEITFANNEIATFEQASARLSTTAPGSSELMLHYTRLPLRSRVLSRVHIVLPATVTLVSASLVPTTNPSTPNYMVVGRPHMLQVRLADDEHHEIHITDDVRIDVTFPTDFFEVNLATPNGSYYHVVPKKKGRVNIDWTFTICANSEGQKQVLKGSLLFTLYDPIDVAPSVLYVPWPSRSSYTYAFVPSGGSGTYAWSVAPSAHSFASIDGDGRLSVRVNTLDLPSRPLSQSQTHMQLQADPQLNHLLTVAVAAFSVYVFDPVDPSNSDQAHVFVLPVSGLRYVPYELEAPVGNHLVLYLTAWHLSPRTDSRNLFTQCHHLPFANTFGAPGTFTDLHEPALPNAEIISREGALANACAVQVMRADRRGLVDLVTQLSVPQQQLAPLPAAASVILSAFEPLALTRPDEPLVAAPGTSIVVPLRHGPAPYPVNVSAFVLTAALVDTQTLKAQPLGSPEFVSDQNLYQHEVKVTCSKYEKAQLWLIAGNTAADYLLKPAVSEKITRVDCAQPTAIAFVVEYPPELSRCPMLSGNAADHFSSGALREFLSSSGNVMPMANWLPLNASLRIYSSARERLLNYSSLDLKYSTTTPKLVKLERQTEAGTDTLTLTPKQAAFVAPFELEALTSGYRSESAYTNGISLASSARSFEPLRATLRVQAFAPLALAARDLVLYHDDPSEAFVRIENGSGHFDASVELIAQNGAAVSSSSNQQEVVGAHIRDSSLRLSAHGNGTAVVTVRDLCLFQSFSAMTVTVRSFQRIQLKVIRMIQLNRQTNIRISVFDNDGAQVPASNLAHVRFQPLLSKPVLTIMSTSSFDGDFVILTAKGTEEGISKLSVVAQLPEGRILQSDELDVIVYPPLASDWPEISLLPGAEFQLRITGGPPNGECQFDYEFTKSNIVQEVAEFGTAGLVLRGVHLGHCEVRVQCVNLEEPPLLTLPIHVLDLPAVRIHAPAHKLLVGARLPLTLYSFDPIGFVAARTVLLRAQWTISNREVGRVEPPVRPIGVEYESDNMHQMLFYAEKPGTTGVHVVVQSTLYDLTNRTLEADVNIEVLPEFLLKDVCNCPAMRVSPGAEFSIEPLPSSTPLNGLHPYSSNRCTVELIPATCSAIEILPPPPTSISCGTVRVLKTPTTYRILHVRSMGPAAETKAISLHVEQPAYISPSIQAAWHLTPLQVSVSSHGSAYELHVLPVGLELPLAIEFFNALGLRFDRVRAHLRYRANRYDMLEVRRIHGDNLTLIVRPLSPGRTILRVWVDDAPNLVAHVLLYAYSIIHPVAQPLTPTLHDLACLHTPWKLQPRSVSGSGLDTATESLDRPPVTWSLDARPELTQSSSGAAGANSRMRGAAYDSAAAGGSGSTGATFFDQKLGLVYLSQAGKLSIYHHFTNRLSTFIQFNVAPVRALRFLNGDSELSETASSTNKLSNALASCKPTRFYLSRGFFASAMQIPSSPVAAAVGSGDGSGSASSPLDDSGCSAAVEKSTKRMLESGEWRWPIACDLSLDEFNAFEERRMPETGAAPPVSVDFWHLDPLRLEHVLAVVPGYDAARRQYFCEVNVNRCDSASVQSLNLMRCPNFPFTDPATPCLNANLKASIVDSSRSSQQISSQSLQLSFEPAFALLFEPTVHIDVTQAHRNYATSGAFEDINHAILLRISTPISYVQEPFDKLFKYTPNDPKVFNVDSFTVDSSDPSVRIVRVVFRLSKLNWNAAAIESPNRKDASSVHDTVKERLVIRCSLLLSMPRANQQQEITFLVGRDRTLLASLEDRAPAGFDRLFNYVSPFLERLFSGAAAALFVVGLVILVLGIFLGMALIGSINRWSAYQQQQQQQQQVFGFNRSAAMFGTPPASPLGAGPHRTPSPHSRASPLAQRSTLHSAWTSPSRPLDSSDASGSGVELWTQGGIGDTSAVNASAFPDGSFHRRPPSGGSSPLSRVPPYL